MTQTGKTAESIPSCRARSPQSPPPRRPHRATRAQLVTRSQLDGRTGAAKTFDRLAGEIASDLGGRDAISAIEAVLIEAFCGSAVVLDGLNAKLLLAQNIDVAEHAAVVSGLVKIASRLGLQRRPRDIGPSERYESIEQIREKLRAAGLTWLSERAADRCGRNRGTDEPLLAKRELFRQLSCLRTTFWLAAGRKRMNQTLGHSPAISWSRKDGSGPLIDEAANAVVAALTAELMPSGMINQSPNR
jgi:hypothetical protein